MEDTIVQQIKQLVTDAAQTVKEFLFGLEEIDAERKRIVEAAVKEVDAQKIAIVKEKINHL